MKAMIQDKIVLPNVSERRKVHILNPVSGSSRYFEAAKAAVEKSGDELLVSEHPGGIRELVAALFRGDPFAHAVVYGGDGTVFEAVNGIMESGAADTASFSVIPSGSGNDFSSYANDSGIFAKADLNRIDLIRVTADQKVRYCANVTNIGFDCDVVREAYTLKKNPLLRGPMSYIAGVVKVLAAKRAIDASVTLSGCEPLGSGITDQPETETYRQKILLTFCANSQNYGGGFHAAPLASVTDGLMDVLVVNDVTRLKFIQLVGQYRAGTYVAEDGVPGKAFSDMLAAKRCRKMVLEGPEFFCIDGEIFPTGEDRRVEMEIVPGAVWFAAL